VSHPYKPSDVHIFGFDTIKRLGVGHFNERCTEFISNILKSDPIQVLGLENSCLIVLFHIFILLVKSLVAPNPLQFRAVLRGD
jgi:hypothetical protein